MKNIVCLLKRSVLLVVLFNMLHCSNDDVTNTEPSEEIVQDTPEQTPEETLPPEMEQQVLRIPVTHHISRTSNGSNAATTNTRTNKIIDDLNAGFQGTNIVFFSKDVRFLDNTAWNTVFDANLDKGRDRVLLPFEDSNSLNIFYFSNLNSGGPDEPLGATALFPTEGNNIKLSSSAFALSNSTTVTHEVGHYLGLYHTDDDFTDTLGRTELVDGSNCSASGDLICDTPASPPLDDSIVGSNCNYIGRLTDANGDLYTPDVLNFMITYAGKDNNGIACRRSFSPQQIEKMQKTIMLQRPQLINGETSNCELLGYIGKFNASVSILTFNDLDAEGNIIENEEDDEDFGTFDTDFLSVVRSSICGEFTFNGDIIGLVDGSSFLRSFSYPVTLTPDANNPQQGTATLTETAFTVRLEGDGDEIDVTDYTLAATGTYKITDGDFTMQLEYVLIDKTSPSRETGTLDITEF